VSIAERAHAARSGVATLLRTAGPEYWLLATLATTATNLLDFATLPVPGELPGPAFFAAAVARVLIVFYATFAIQRRMAKVSAPFAAGAPFVRFLLFSLAFAALYAAIGAGLSYGVMLPAMSISSQWLALLALAGLWGVLLIRLAAWGPALATGEPFRALPGLFRRLRRSQVPLAFVFLQLVLPFAAIHLALALLGARLPLSGTAFAALALIDGVITAIQLLIASALGVFAWRIAQDRDGALREAPGRR
jgi:hypothetical protein